ncbi:MAG TPA: ABC transporter permease [Vicinamibacteria bacterium]|nr:ABC transporter permease [Vicinamibacteria bacterium]
MRVLVRMIVKEFFQLARDRKMIPVLLVGPLAQLIALGYAANMDIALIPLLLVDQDRSAESRALLERFTGSGYFDLAGSVETADAVEPWLVDGRAQVALVVPEGYGEDVAAGRTPRLQLVADGTDANSAVLGLQYAARIVQGLGVELVAARVDRAARRADAARVELKPRVWYNPDLKSRWFYVPAVLAMVLMLVTMILPSMAVVREKELGTLEQIIVTPLQAWQLVLGKLVPFVVIGLLDMLLVTAVARFLFGVPLRGSLVFLTLVTLLFLLNTLGLGLLVSTLVSTQQQAMMSCIYLLMVPMIYLSGLIFPIENMPAGFQYATYVIPVRYYADVLRGVFLRGSGIGVLWPEAVTLLGMGTLILVLASLRFRKSLD